MCKANPRRLARKANFDAVIISAGFSGMYMLHSLRDKLDLNVTVFEAGDSVGGTWYWNRYSGARCDSDSYIYCYTFDKNLLQEWNWSERYPEQDEVLRYLEHCAERFDLKPDIQFGKSVVEVVFDDDTELWTVRTDKGDTVTARFVIPAVGALYDRQHAADQGAEHTMWCMHPVNRHRGQIAAGAGSNAIKTIEKKPIGVGSRSAPIVTPLRRRFRYFSQGVTAAASRGFVQRRFTRRSRPEPEVAAPAAHLSTAWQRTVSSAH